MLRLLKILGVALMLAILAAMGTAVFEYYEPIQQQAEKQDETKAIEILANERVAYYTKVLAIFTAVLSGFGLLQIFFLIRANESASRTARAAQESAEHIPKVERAYVFAGPKGPIGITGNGNLWFDLSVVNHGKTPGIVREMCINFSQGVPASRDFDGDEKRRTTDVVLPPGEELKGSEDSLRWYSPFTKAHYTCGYVRYLDVFKKPHASYFCLLIRPDGTMEIAGPPELNDWD